MFFTAIRGSIQVATKLSRGEDFEATGEADNTSTVGGGPLNASYLKYRVAFPTFFLELQGTYNGSSCQTSETESENVVTCEPAGGISAGSKMEFRITGTISPDAPFGLANIGGKVETELFNPDPVSGNFSATTNIVGMVTRDQAANIVSGRLPELCPDKPDLETAWGFMPQQPLPAGSELSSKDETEYSVTLDKDVWFGMVQCSPSLKYVQRTYYIEIETETESEEPEVVVNEANWWPLVDGVKIWGGYGTLLTTDDRIFGEDPPMDPGPTVTLTDEITTTPEPQPERTCAILVSGEGEDETEQEAFNFDVDIMRGNLMREKLGPQLAEQDVVVMENPTFSELETKLKELKDQYAKVYFFYSGHGSQYGLSIRGSDVGMLFFDLKTLLYDSNAPNLCVIIDACQSGGAGSRFKNDSRWKERNITLITSSDSAKSAITTTLARTGDGTKVRGGVFSYNFALGFGSPEADANSDGMTTLEETFTWLREENPELARGRVNDRMNPQICVNEVVEDVRQSVISSPSTGVTVTPVEPLDSGAGLRFEVRSGVTSFETEDPNVLEISPGRTWSLEGYDQSSSLDLSIQFKYSAGFDFTVDDDVSPGLAKLTFDPGKRTVVGWVAHSPTVWDPENQTITAHHVTGFGEWVIARTSVASAVAVDDDVPVEIDGLLAQNYPNPFRSSTTIQYAISRSDLVEVTVVDLLGRTVARLVNARQEPGAYSVVWNGNSSEGKAVSPGMYVYRIRVGEAEDAKLMSVAR
ncbi:MAG TPA: T9SS type A sorting domain-containing protein [Rhodothermales bacterium]|nr:T9SS type A sorting domain-containing protein [Rhodothermales bacterium]